MSRNTRFKYICHFIRGYLVLLLPYEKRKTDIKKSTVIFWFRKSRLLKNTKPFLVTNLLVIHNHDSLAGKSFGIWLSSLFEYHCTGKPSKANSIMEWNHFWRIIVFSMQLCFNSNLDKWSIIVHNFFVWCPTNFLFNIIFIAYLEVILPHYGIHTIMVCRWNVGHKRIF